VEEAPLRVLVVETLIDRIFAGKKKEKKGFLNGTIIIYSTKRIRILGSCA
jgi:hypothetical protein